MSSITSTLALLEPPQITAMPTYWEHLKAGDEIVWAARANTTRQFDMKVWEAAGSLRTRFRGELKTLFQDTCKEEENYEYIHGKSHLQVLPSYHCYLLSNTEDVADAKPVFVIKCRIEKIAQKTVEILRDDAHITALDLGIEFLAHSDAVRLRTGDNENDLRSRSEFDPFGSLCGCRIVVTADLPARESGKYRQGTLGGVILLGGTYFGVTSAHILDESDSDDEATKPASGRNVNQKETVRQDESFTGHLSHSGDGSHANMRGRSTIQALYTESLRSVKTHITSRSESVNVRPVSGVAKYLVGHFVAQPKGSPAGQPTLVASRYEGRSLDWSLTEVVDTRFKQNNAARDDEGQVYTVRSVWSSADPPTGEAIVLSGIRGPSAALCNGGVAGITFPWSREIEEVWVVEYDSAPGESGSWVITPKDGCVFGMLVAGSTDSKIAYVVPANRLFEDILSQWSDCEQSLKSILPPESTIPATTAENIQVTSAGPDLRVIPDAVAEQSSESQMNYLLSLWLLHIPVIERQQLEKDSALGSDMADLSMEDSRVLEPLRNLEPTLRRYAQIPETEFVLSVDFLSEHADAFGVDQVEMLLKAGVDFCKQKYQYTARAVIHQAALLHRRLTLSEKDFQAFRRGMVQENWNVIDSWFWEVSQSFKELTKIVPEEMGADPTRAVRSHYAKLVFDLGKPIHQISVPIRGTPGFAESVDDRYRIRNKPEQFFQPGRVFEMLWNFESMPSLLSSLSRSGHDLQSRESSSSVLRPFVRRMVVIEQRDQISSCLSISSYGGRGVAKRGFKTQDQHLHAIIHMAGVQPAPVAGEEGMDLRPIAVESYDERVLDSMSRINFAITYEVGWDVKVRHLGKVPQSSLKTLHANHAAIRAEMKFASTRPTDTSTAREAV